MLPREGFFLHVQSNQVRKLQELQTHISHVLLRNKKRKTEFCSTKVEDIKLNHTQPRDEFTVSDRRAFPSISLHYPSSCLLSRHRYALLSWIRQND